MESSSTMLTTGKRILIFSTSYLPFVGGAEIAVKEITDRLSDEFEFDLITAKIDRTLPSVELVGAVNVYRIGLGLPVLDKLLLPFLGAYKALKLDNKRGYKAFWGIMVTFASGAAYLANILRKIMGKRQARIILTLQEGDSEEHFRSRWFGLINLSWKLALARTDFLTVISRYLLERATKLGYKGKSVLIPNGVDFSKFENPNPRVLDASKVKLITTSRLVEKNAVGDIIEALKFLPETTTLSIVGNGPLEKVLKDKVRLMGLEKRVEFVGGVLYEEIPKYLHQADIFVRPSLSEGFGNSFIEAMAAGLPVIATPVGGITDFLLDGETGLFVEPKNPRLLAFQIHKLIDDRVLRDKMTINAKRMVRERYTWDLIAEEMRSKVFNV